MTWDLHNLTWQLFRTHHLHYDLHVTYDNEKMNSYKITWCEMYSNVLCRVWMNMFAFVKFYRFQDCIPEGKKPEKPEKVSESRLTASKTG